MKEPNSAGKSRLVFKVLGRSRRLIRRTPSGSWHVRFNIDGKDKLVSLKTTEVETAKVRAKHEIEDAYAAKNGDPAAAERLTKAKFATIGDIVDRYDPNDIDPETARTNRAAFLRLVKITAVQTSGDPRTVSAELLKDARLVKEFQKRHLAKLRAAGADFDDQESGKISVNSTVRQARSLFAPERLELYQGLRLPKLTDFLEAPALKVDADVSFVPFPPGTIEGIEAKLPEMPLRVRRATLLMVRCGLRNKEVEFSKVEWFRRFPDGSSELSIERRPYFKVKNRSVRTLRLSAELTAALELDWSKPGAWLMDCATETDRKFAAHDEINTWLRPFLPGRTKCAYELRKHAGSVILTRPEQDGGGLAAAARFLGDTVATTERHYARYLRPVTAVGAEEVRAQFSVVKAA